MMMLDKFIIKNLFYKFSPKGVRSNAIIIILLN